MLFVFLAVLSGMLVQRFWVRPSSVLWILNGVWIGYLGGIGGIDGWKGVMGNELLLYFIPPIIYQACLQVSFHSLKKLLGIVLPLSLCDVLVSFSLQGVYLLGVGCRLGKWGWLLGVILSPIDPVVITSILNELRIPEKLNHLIEIESLLNDEMALLVYYLVYYSLIGSSVKWMVYQSFKQVIGGIMISGVIVIIQWWVMWKWVGDGRSHIILSLVSCYLVYWLAEYTILDTSGFMAVLVLGLAMSCWGRTRICPQYLSSFYETFSLLAHYATILIFTCSGLLIAHTLDYQGIERMDWLRMVGLYLVGQIGRVIICGVFRPWLGVHVFHYDYIDFMIMALSGIRGEVSLALSLIVYYREGIGLEERNLILFYVSGVVMLGILLNGNLVQFLVHYYHRDRIKMTAQQLEGINYHIDREGQNYIETLKRDDFHLQKVDYSKVESLLFPHLEGNEIELGNQTNQEIETDIFLHTLKKTIWTLFQSHQLHYDVVVKLIDITDSALDHPELPWKDWMNDYCRQEHIHTSLICFLDHIPFLQPVQSYLIYHKIEYNYNLIMGYMVALEVSLSRTKEMLDGEAMRQELEREVIESLYAPQCYVEYLEGKYGEMIEKIETRSVCLLVMSKQRSHLEEMMKNGEISERSFDILRKKLTQKETRLKHVGM